MTKKEIITKIKESKLGGRGGANFAVYLKWEAVKKALAKKKNSDAYLLINAAEGEPNLIKDGHILSNYFTDILFGLNMAISYLGEKKVKKIYCFIREDYYKENKLNFEKRLKKNNLLHKFKFFIKPDKDDYMAGEESVLLNIIENKAAKPRLKPPFPVENGLFSQPTLIHNVETWQAIGLIAQAKYSNNRFYYLSGKINNPGLFYLSEKLSVKEILKKTKNWPRFRFFTQIGGDACGQVLLDKQLNVLADGSGSITIYPLKTKEAQQVLLNWLKFHCQQSCGQCIPCREGTYRLLEMFENNNIKARDLTDIVFSLKYSSFCAFGSSLAMVIENYFKNINPELKAKGKINIQFKS